MSLPDNMIGRNEIKNIAYVLKRNTPLRILNLSRNKIDPKAALILADSLRPNSTLRELNLSYNILGDAGIAVIAEIFIL